MVVLKLMEFWEVAVLVAERSRIHISRQPQQLVFRAARSHELDPGDDLVVGNDQARDLVEGIAVGVLQELSNSAGLIAPGAEVALGEEEADHHGLKEEVDEGLRNAGLQGRQLRLGEREGLLSRALQTHLLEHKLRPGLPVAAAEQLTFWSQVVHEGLNGRENEEAGIERLSSASMRVQ